MVIYSQSSYARGNRWSATSRPPTRNLHAAVYEARQVLMLHQTTNQRAFAVVIDRDGFVWWQGRHFKGDLYLGPTTSRGLERLSRGHFPAVRGGRAC